ncbi:FAD synthetase family protein [Solibacillus sp. NPDC093137]|uniref:FAD synthetase family protein n=1 Tax=Solibacillus sp. NPDC093137 TaxID=3390678 RepID=UPI003D089BC1
MKTIIVNEKNLPIVQQNSEPAVMALGFFDGVHKGHQQVILAARKKAQKKGLKLAVMSFFPHPKTVFSNEEVDYLMPMEKKAERFQSLGVDLFYIVDFTKSFAALQPKQFVQQYLVGLQVQYAVAGFDYTYGAKGAGTIATIQSDSDWKIKVDVVKRFAISGKKVSSTCIREKLKRGYVEEVTALLGKPYSVQYSMKYGLHDYYTLPQCGEYYVTILAGKRAISQKVYVKNTKDIIFYHDLNIEDCSIYFHQRATQKYQEIS